MTTSSVSTITLVGSFLSIFVLIILISQSTSHFMFDSNDGNEMTSLKSGTNPTIFSSLERNPSCISAPKLQDMIDQFSQIVIVMPDKAAGSSSIVFANHCYPGHKLIPDNFVNHEEVLKRALTMSFQVPRLFASHVVKAEHFINLIKGVARDTLVVYIHHEETDRLLSAIKHATMKYCTGERITSRFEFLESTNESCTIAEIDLVDKIISSGRDEVPVGMGKILTCETYQSFEENRSNLVFMDYKEANTLYTLLAEKHCPQMLEQSVHVNAASDKKKKIFVALSHGTTEKVSLEDWLHEKKYFLEWSLGLKKDFTCQGKTRIMENSLLQCPSGFLHWH